MYENYLTFGGVEIANTDRLVGYAKSGDCIVSWLRAEGCGVTSQAVGDGLPYTIDNIDRAPWYDIANHDLSSRFYGAMVVDQKGLSDSTRQASLIEGIADGGVLGGFRRAGREARFRLLLVANGRDAMDYGMNWLSSALDGRKCGQHGDRCGTTDLSFWVDCPPITTMIGAVPFGPTITNLFTNPSFEGESGKAIRRTNPGLTEAEWASSGIPGKFFDGDTPDSRAKRYEWTGTPGASPSIEWTPNMVEIAKNIAPPIVGSGDFVEVRRNRARRPRAVSGSHWGVSPGTGGSASMTHLPEWGTIPEPFLRATVTRAATGQPNITNIQPTPTSQTWVDVTPGETITYSLYVAASGREVRVGIRWYVDGYTLISSQFLPYEVHEIEQPRRRGETVTVPAGATSCRIIVEMDGAELGDSLLAGALMVGSGEEYFDGSTTLATAGDTVQPEDFRWRWLGEPNASESVMEIERVRGLTSSLAIAGKSTWEGLPAVRIIPTASSASSMAYVSIPPEARESGTVVATLRSHAPQRGTRNSSALKLRVGAPLQDSGNPPNEEGTFPQRHSYTGLTGTYRMYLWNGASRGNGDVWWTDIGLFAGQTDDRIPGFDGDTVPDDIDWTCWWNEDGTSSIGMIDSGTGSSLLSWVGLSKKWSAEGEYSLRVIPSSPENNSGAFFIAPEEFTGGTLKGIVRLESSLNRPPELEEYGNQVIATRGDSTWSTPFPNVPGEHEVTLNIPEGEGPITITFRGGAPLNGGDMWIDLLTLVEGEYDGPPFSGSSEEEYISPNEYALFEWTGDEHDSTSTRTMYRETIVPDQEAIDASTRSLTRFMHDTAVVSGPLLVEQLPTAGGDHVGTIVEFTVASERGYIYGAPKTLSLAEAELGSAADIGVNMVQNPRSRRVGSQLSTVVRNAVSNPSFETNLNGWSTAPLQSDYSISRPYRGPRSSGDYSMLVSGAGIFRVFHTIPASSRSGSSRAVASVWVSLTGPTEPAYASLIVSSSLGTVENRVTDNLPGRTITIEDIEVPATGDVTIEIQGDFPGTNPWNPGLMHVDAVLFLMEG